MDVAMLLVRSVSRRRSRWCGVREESDADGRAQHLQLTFSVANSIYLDIMQQKEVILKYAF